MYLEIINLPEVTTFAYFVQPFVGQCTILNHGQTVKLNMDVYFFYFFGFYQHYNYLSTTSQE